MAERYVEQRLLAFHVEVYRALGDAHGLRHIGHLRAPVALRDEDRSGGIDQFLETNVRRRSGHAPKSTLTDWVSQDGESSFVEPISITKHAPRRA
jgi:hypothetical protein